MEEFNSLLVITGLIAAIVFVCLYYVDAGYGKMRTAKWGPTIPSKLGWAIMECPVFFLVLYFWAVSPVRFEWPYLIFFLLFEFHYFHRSFVCPMLMRGNSEMPIVIALLSFAFNLLNGHIQGRWLFELAPQYQPYAEDWWLTPQFIVGLVIFCTGMAINMHSDYIIRHLRKPGDTKHYLPKGGFYNYVTSANYFGECVEWLGWAILTWSWAGLIFFVFTAANLVPRSNAIWHRYEQVFHDEFHKRKPALKRIIPFIY